jgi:hypothetical protein
LLSGRFISVSNSLPKTSYVKMIDIWLLFNLVLPFAEVSLFTSTSPQVLLQTYIEHLRGIIEDKQTINHHGKSIEVEDDSEKVTEPTQVFVLP